MTKKVICIDKMGGQKPCQKRIDYIDLLKGIAIFGVIWLHSIGCPEWLTATLVNSTFFFLSGVFFKVEPFSMFIKKKAKTLLIPFITFYLLSYPYRIVEHYWDFRTLTDFDYLCIFDLFDVVGRSDYLFVNVPLWFLLCLFVVQILYYFLSKIPKSAIIILIILCMFFEDYISSIPTPFMINNAIYWVGFFAVGNLCGRFLIKLVNVIRYRLILLCCSLLVIIGLTILVENLTNDRIIEFAYRLKMFAVFGLLFAAGSFFDGWRILKPIRFLGLNSLALLCMHVPVLIVFGRIASKLSDHNPTSLLGFACALLTSIVCCLATIYCNKHCPVIVGKSR